jgi:hypothetical protein
MVADTGAGSGRGSQVLKFKNADFDGWLIFLKAFLMKFDRLKITLLKNTGLPHNEVSTESIYWQSLATKPDNSSSHMIKSMRLT